MAACQTSYSDYLSGFHEPLSTSYICHTDPNTGSHERLFILTRTRSMHIFWEIPFIKPQNDT